MTRYLTITSVYFIIFAAAIIYFLGASGPLLLDDFQNLEPLGYFGGVQDSESALRFVFGNGSGPLGRPVSMASFLLNDAAWPTYNVINFKLTNLAFHLCTGLVLFILTSRLLQQEFEFTQRLAESFALVVMGIWLLHPIHVSTVLYVIQRMAILSALFSLMTFICYIQFRFFYQSKRYIQSTLFCLLGILFFILAVFSKENALLVIPFIILCELFIFKCLLPYTLKLYARWIIYLLIFTSPGWLYATYDLWGSSYTVRDFDLAERLILQIAVLGDYLGKLILPTVGSMNLFDERFTPAAISFSNSAFMKGLLFSLSLSVLLFYAMYKKNPLIVFGVVWFLCFHLMESTILPLEIYFEHRNYLPSIGIVIVFVSLVNSLRQKFPSSFVPVSLVVFILIYLCFASLILSKTWSEPSTLFIKSTGDQPSSVRAKVSYASYLEARGLPDFAMAEIEEAMLLRPDMLSLTLNKLRLSCEYDLTINVGEHLEKIRNSSFFETGALFQFKKLIAMGSDACPIFRDNPSLIENTLESVSTMKGYGSRSDVMAQFYFIKSDYYVGKRGFEQAIAALDRAIEFTPTVDFFLKKAVLLTSAGLYQEAIYSTQNALEADQKRSYFIPSRADEIEFVLMSLRNQLKKS